MLDKHPLDHKRYKKRQELKFKNNVPHYLDLPAMLFCLMTMDLHVFRVWIKNESKKVPLNSVSTLKEA